MSGRVWLVSVNADISCARNDIAGFQNQLGVFYINVQVWGYLILCDRDFLLHTGTIRICVLVESRLVCQQKNIVHAGKVCPCCTAGQQYSD
jgi:hypothetical protein